MSQTYIFHREGSCYPMELKDDTDARKNAEDNRGTMKVTDAQGSRTVWEVPAPQPSLADKLNAALAEIDRLKLTLMDRPIQRLGESNESFLSKYQAWYRSAHDVLNQK